MTEKKLKKLSRAELIQLLIDVTDENESLREENLKLKKQLEDKNILIDSSGNIAEASLALNKIFENAQEAADQYVESVKRQHLEQAKDMVRKAQQEIENIERETRLRCSQMEEKANAAAEAANKSV